MYLKYLFTAKIFENKINIIQLYVLGIQIIHMYFNCYIILTIFNLKIRFRKKNYC